VMVGSRCSFIATANHAAAMGGDVQSFVARTGSSHELCLQRGIARTEYFS